MEQQEEKYMLQNKQKIIPEFKAHKERTVWSDKSLKRKRKIGCMKTKWKNNNENTEMNDRWKNTPHIKITLTTKIQKMQVTHLKRMISERRYVYKIDRLAFKLLIQIFVLVQFVTIKINAWLFPFLKKGLMSGIHTKTYLKSMIFIIWGFLKSVKKLHYTYGSSSET